MFRLIAILSLILAIAVFVVGLRRRRAEASAEAAPKPFTWFQRALYLIMLIGILGAGLTGLGMVIATGHHLEGWGLMIHCAIAPAFAVGMAGVALTFADRYCFRSCILTGAATRAKCTGCTDAMFWGMLISGLIVILTALLPMTGYNQHWQHTLLYLHRWSSLVLAVLTIMHASRVVRA